MIREAKRPGFDIDGVNGHVQRRRTVIELGEPEIEGSALSYHGPRRLSRSYTRRARSVASDEGTGDRDATIRRQPKHSQQSSDEAHSTPDMSSSETPPCVSPFIYPIRVPMLILLSPSPAEVHAQTTEAGSFRMATLLYRFHSEGSGQHYREAQRRTGGQGGRSRICKPQRR